MQREDEESDDDAEHEGGSVSQYTGVSIKVRLSTRYRASSTATDIGLQVSFNSKVDEGLRIQQLSGGQKSLVALATSKSHVDMA